jgi:hypothetical protein
MKKYGLTIMLACMVSAAAQAQTPSPAPVDDLSGREGAVLHSQQRAGMAYRQLQQAQYETKLAEQDYLNAEDARRLAQKRVDELRREAETAKKAFDAVKAKEAAARAAYEKEVNAVDRLHRTPQK